MDIQKKALLWRDMEKVLEHAMAYAVQDTLRSSTLEEDLIRQAQARRYLRRLGKKASLLERWTKEGLLHPVKRGEARNSPKLFSLSEIKKVMTMLQLSRLRHDMDC